MNGPTTVEVVKKYLSCYGCKFYSKQVLFWSDRAPGFAHNCSNPKLIDILLVVGNLPDEDRTPKWCPEMKEENNG